MRSHAHTFNGAFAIVYATLAIIILATKEPFRIASGAAAAAAETIPWQDNLTIMAFPAYTVAIGAPLTSIGKWLTAIGPMVPVTMLTGGVPRYATLAMVTGYVALVSAMRMTSAEYAKAWLVLILQLGVGAAAYITMYFHQAGLVPLCTLTSVCILITLAMCTAMLGTGDESDSSSSAAEPKKKE